MLFRRFTRRAIVFLIKSYCFTVRVKGGKSLRNGMWNGVRKGIIIRNTIYAGNKLSEGRVMFSSQFYKSSSFFDVTDSC